jgi:hypothetical protein
MFLVSSGKMSRSSGLSPTSRRPAVAQAAVNSSRSIPFRFATDPAEHDGRVARPACVDTLVITINEIGSDTSMKIGDASDARVET